MDEGRPGCTLIHERLEEYMPGSPAFLVTPVYEKMPKSIFVGGLTADTSEEDLQHAFQNYGEISSVKVIREFNGASKGYGFVTFIHPKGTHAARDLEKNPPMIRGRHVKISDAFHRLMFPKAADYKIATPSGEIKSSDGYDYYFTLNHPYTLLGVTPLNPFVNKRSDYKPSDPSDNRQQMNGNNSSSMTSFPPLAQGQRFLFPQHHQPPTPITAPHTNGGTAFDYGSVIQGSQPMPFPEAYAPFFGVATLGAYNKYTSQLEEIQRRVYQHVPHAEYPRSQSGSSLGDRFGRMQLSNNPNTRISYSAKVSGYGTQRSDHSSSTNSNGIRSCEIGAGDGPPPSRYNNNYRYSNRNRDGYNNNRRDVRPPMTPPSTPSS